MKKFIFKLENEYEVEAEDEDEAFNELEEKIHRNNSTPEVEFWDSLEIEEVK